MSLLRAFYLHVWLVIPKYCACLVLCLCRLNIVNTWRVRPALHLLAGIASISLKQGWCVWGKDMGIRNRRLGLEINTFLLVLPVQTTWIMGLYWEVFKIKAITWKNALQTIKCYTGVQACLVNFEWRNRIWKEYWLSYQELAPNGSLAP